MVEIRLELRGHAEVVHGQTEHDHVGVADLADQRVALGDHRLLLGRACFGRGEKGLKTGAVKVGHRLRGQIADHDAGVGVGRLPGLDEAVAELRGLALVAKQAGVDL